MLYVLGFSLRMQHPHYNIAQIWAEGKASDDPAVSDFWQRTATADDNLLQVHTAHYDLLLQSCVSSGRSDDSYFGATMHL